MVMTAVVAGVERFLNYPCM